MSTPQDPYSPPPGGPDQPEGRPSEPGGPPSADSPWQDAGQGQPQYGQPQYGQPQYGQQPGWGGPPGYAQPYGAQPYGAQPYGPRKTNTLAIVSLVLIFVFTPAALVTGIIARKQIRQNGEDGNGMALAGVICGALSIAFFAVVIVVFIIAAAATSTGGGSGSGSSYSSMASLATLTG